MKKIRTVTGDVPAEKMGRTLTHEHLLYTYPGGEYDHKSSFELDKAVDRIATELKAGAAEYKYGTLVDMTPAEVGRHPELMKRVSEKTGVNVIAVSGFFPERMGIPYWFRRQTVEELADFYIRDLTDGMVFAGGKTGIKAGAIKIATGQESVEPKPSPIGPNGRRIHLDEDRLIRAAGRAQKATGCCINTHTDPMDYTVTNPGIEQLEEATCVAIDHQDVPVAGRIRSAFDERVRRDRIADLVGLVVVVEGDSRAGCRRRDHLVRDAISSV